MHGNKKVTFPPKKISRSTSRGGMTGQLKQTDGYGIKITTLFSTGEKIIFLLGNREG